MHQWLNEMSNILEVWTLGKRGTIFDNGYQEMEQNEEERNLEDGDSSKAASNRGECKRNHGAKYSDSSLVYLRGATSMAD